MGYRKSTTKGKKAEFTNKYQVRDMRSDSLIPLDKAMVDHNFIVTDKYNFDPINPKEQPARLRPDIPLPYTRPDQYVLRPDVLPTVNYNPLTWDQIDDVTWATWTVPWGERNF